MTLDELIGRAAAFINAAYEIGRRDAAAAIAAEAQKMLGAPAIAPKPAAPAIKPVTEPEPPAVRELSALRPDAEGADVAPEGEGAPPAGALPSAITAPLPKRVKPWAEDDAELRRLFAEGKSDQQIGDALGRTPAAIQQRRSVLKLRRGDSFAEGAATRAEAAASAQALETARAALGATTEPSPDPAPAVADEPAAANPPPAAPSPQPQAPVAPAPDTEVERAIERLRRGGDKISGPVLGLWRVNNRPHSRAELLARVDRVAPPASAPHRPAPAPVPPAPAREPSRPRPLPPSRGDELAEIEAAIAGGKMNLMPSGADLAEVMKDVPPLEYEACTAWCEREGIKVVRNGTRYLVGAVPVAKLEFAGHVQRLAREKAMTAWRARQATERTPDRAAAEASA